MLCTEVVPSIGALLDAGFKELRLQEVEKRRCMIDCGLGILPQPPAQTSCSVPMALFISIGTSQVSNGSAMEITDALGYLKVCAR